MIQHPCGSQFIYFNLVNNGQWTHFYPMNVNIYDKDEKITKGRYHDKRKYVQDPRVEPIFMQNPVSKL